MICWTPRLNPPIMLLKTVERNDRRPRKDVLERRLEHEWISVVGKDSCYAKMKRKRTTMKVSSLFFSRVDASSRLDRMSQGYLYPFIDVISISRVLHDSGISQKRRYIRFTYIIPRTDRLIRTRSRRLIIARFDVIIGFDQLCEPARCLRNFHRDMKGRRGGGRRKKKEKNSPYTRRDSSVDARHRDTERWTACWQLSTTKQLTADQFSKRTTLLSLTERSNNLRITIFSRSDVHRSSHLQRRSSTGSAWSIIDEFILMFDSPTIFFYSFFRFEKKARRKTGAETERRKRRAARSMAKADGTRMELVSFGSRTERIGLSIRNALARCPDQDAPRPRFVSPFLSPSSFLPNIVLPLEGKTQRLKKN